MLEVAQLLPVEDEPSPPTDLSDVSSAPWENVDTSSRVAQATTPQTLLVPVRLAAGTFVPLRARLVNTNVQNPSFQWTGATHRLTAGKESVADLVIAANQGITITVTETTTGESRQMVVAAVAPTPPLIVPGQADLTWVLKVTRYQLQQGVQVDPGNHLSASHVTVFPGNLLAMKLSAQDDAQRGLRDIALIQGGESVVIKNALTVYRGFMKNLLDHLDRPAFGATPARLGEMELHGGPRTQAQENRIQAVLSANGPDQVRQAWNTLTRVDGALTVIRTELTATQLDILYDAAVQFEGMNPSFPAFSDPVPPTIPLSLWRRLMGFMAPLESGYLANGSVVALAGATDESSTGLLQFNDGRASGNNFSGRIAVPIYRPGRIEWWKGKIDAASTLGQLRQAVVDLDEGNWRADPYASLINLIRSSHAYYSSLVVPPSGSYDPDESFRADPGSGRANGQGSQRDCFEVFAVAHQLPANVFDGPGTGLEGGLWRATTPDEWRVSTDNSSNGLPYMDPQGMTRAGEARSYYNNNAPTNGYQYP
ncbi:MAG TPA: hypothetical protein PLU35_09560 [Phycisphaerales bacterium]|nr:hypothetical protein [Phycisphaerales bacterium]